RGEVRFEGRNLLALPPREMRRMRRRVQIIFQDPFSSLNPRLTVNDIVGEGLRLHEPGLGEAEYVRRIGETLGEVGLSPDVGY
ncbi:MAG: microcin ABC transporter ATP-binding protein, partial [Gammaproteobacteria bacterium]|nr:microcin ABC transporter ATP-binding protein [Gammaproteobacteria bacterium]